MYIVNKASSFCTNSNLWRAIIVIFFFSIYCYYLKGNCEKWRYIIYKLQTLNIWWIWTWIRLLLVEYYNIISIVSYSKIISLICLFWLFMKHDTFCARQNESIMEKKMANFYASRSPSKLIGLLNSKARVVRSVAHRKSTRVVLTIVYTLQYH